MGLTESYAMSSNFFIASYSSILIDSIAYVSASLLNLLDSFTGFSFIDDVLLGIKSNFLLWIIASIFLYCDIYLIVDLLSLLVISLFKYVNTLSTPYIIPHNPIYTNAFNCFYELYRLKQHPL